MAEKTKNVYQRLNEAYKVIHNLDWVKEQKNTAYASVPIDKMRAGVREACIEAGLVHIGPIDLYHDFDDMDGRKRAFIVTAKFEYVNIDDPSDRVTYESIGEAIDPFDKGLNKAMTSMVKNHYKLAFDIGEGNKDDTDMIPSFGPKTSRDELGESIVETKVSKVKRRAKATATPPEETTEPAPEPTPAEEPVVAQEPTPAPEPAKPTPKSEPAAVAPPSKSQLFGLTSKAKKMATTDPEGAKVLTERIAQLKTSDEAKALMEELR